MDLAAVGRAAAELALTRLRYPRAMLLRPLALALLAFLALGCDCSGPERGACDGTGDCRAGEVCVDGACAPAPDGGPRADAPAPADAPSIDAPLALTIAPADPVIEAAGRPTELAFRALLGGTELASVTWLLSDVVLGTIASDGTFTANGLVAGRVELTARYGELEARTRVTVRVNVSEPLAGLSDADVAALRAGGAADPSFRVLYPYDDTVFPRGLAAPVFQLGGAADAIRITLDLDGPDFHYEGFFAGGATLQRAVPQAVWDAATESAGARDPLRVGITRIAGGVVNGPVTETLHIAPGRLTGSIYYNTYYSPLASGGAILRVPLGGDAEVVQAGCTVCHSVSANGGRIATGLDWSGTETITGTGNPRRSGTLDLDVAGTPTARWTDPDGRKFAFGALTPDGARLVNNAVPPDNRIRGLSGTLPSRLWDAETGAELAAPSFTDVVRYAVTPAFAPDASALAFSWFADGSATNGRILAVMSYDGGTVFGAPRRVVSLADATRIVGWPAFLPDGRAVIYQEGTGFDTSVPAGASRPNAPVFADLRLVDLTSCDAAGENCAVSGLEVLNGYAEGGFYPPYGEGEEAHSNFEPTVLPVAVGGYYWVVFTSRRCYGNTIAPGGTLPGGDDRWGRMNAEGGEIPSLRKKLWIAAIDLTGAPGSDRSHPAFFLSGQELESGNMRGFAALDPCRPDGAGCASAADCCGGFCRDTAEPGAPPMLTCVPPPGGCSEELEACTTSADCCGALGGATCINGRCAAPGVE